MVNNFWQHIFLDNSQNVAAYIENIAMIFIVEYFPTWRAIHRSTVQMEIIGMETFMIACN